MQWNRSLLVALLVILLLVLLSFNLLHSSSSSTQTSIAYFNATGSKENDSNNDNKLVLLVDDSSSKPPLLTLSSTKATATTETATTTATSSTPTLLTEAAITALPPTTPTSAFFTTVAASSTAPTTKTTTTTTTIRSSSTSSDTLVCCNSTLSLQPYPLGCYQDDRHHYGNQSTSDERLALCPRDHEIRQEIKELEKTYLSSSSFGFPPSSSLSSSFARSATSWRPVDCLLPALLTQQDPMMRLCKLTLLWNEKDRKDVTSRILDLVLKRKRFHTDFSFCHNISLPWMNHTELAEVKAKMKNGKLIMDSSPPSDSVYELPRNFSSSNRSFCFHGRHGIFTESLQHRVSPRIQLEKRFLTLAKRIRKQASSSSSGCPLDPKEFLDLVTRKGELVETGPPSQTTLLDLRIPNKCEHSLRFERLDLLALLSRVATNNKRFLGTKSLKERNRLLQPFAIVGDSPARQLFFRYVNFLRLGDKQLSFDHGVHKPFIYVIYRRRQQEKHRTSKSKDVNENDKKENRRNKKRPWEPVLRDYLTYFLSDPSLVTNQDALLARLRKILSSEPPSLTSLLSTKKETTTTTSTTTTPEDDSFSDDDDDDIEIVVKIIHFFDPFDDKNDFLNSFPGGNATRVEQELVAAAEAARKNLSALEDNSSFHLLHPHNGTNSKRNNSSNTNNIRNIIKKIDRSLEVTRKRSLEDEQKRVHLVPPAVHLHFKNYWFVQVERPRSTGQGNLQFGNEADQFLINNGTQIVVDETLLYFQDVLRRQQKQSNSNIGSSKYRFFLLESLPIRLVTAFYTLEQIKMLNLLLEKRNLHRVKVVKNWEKNLSATSFSSSSSSSSPSSDRRSSSISVDLLPINRIFLRNLTLAQINNSYSVDALHFGSQILGHPVEQLRFVQTAENILDEVDSWILFLNSHVLLRYELQNMEND